MPDRLIRDRFGRTEMGADRIATAQVTLDYQVALRVVQRATKRTGRHAGQATHAPFLVQFHGARLRVPGNGANQAGLGAGGVIALQARDRDPEFRESAREGIDTT